MKISVRKMKGAKRCACLIMCLLLVFIYTTGTVFADDSLDEVEKSRIRYTRRIAVLL